MATAERKEAGAKNNRVSHVAALGGVARAGAENHGKRRGGGEKIHFPFGFARSCERIPLPPRRKKKGKIEIERDIYSDIYTLTYTYMYIYTLYTHIYV